MSSAAAKYEQGRQDRITDIGSRNGLIDESAFKGGQELARDRLVLEKKILEADISELNARIGRAKSHLRERGTFTPSKTFHGWEMTKAAKVRRILEIEAVLLTDKQEAKRNRPSDWDRGSFAECFKEAAREMLAGPVFDRIQTAAIHRMSEMNETVGHCVSLN